MSRLDPTNPIVAMLIGLADRFRVHAELGPLTESERADGRTVLVTGASSGLGFATSVDLARRGAYVLMADCREPTQAARRAAAQAGSASVEGLNVDLSDLESIERLCAALTDRGANLDVVVLCAATVPLELRRTRQGLNEMFVVNYGSSFVLLRRLLELGVIRPRPADAAPEVEPPRIIFISSEAHRWSEALDLGDIGRFRDYRARNVLATYAYCKLMLTTFACELDRRLNPSGQPRVSVSSLCPGGMSTNIIREVPRALRGPLGLVMRLVFRSPFQADEPVVFLACSRAMAKETGAYLHRMARKQPDPRAAEPRIGRELWEKTEALFAQARNPGAR